MSEAKWFHEDGSRHLCDCFGCLNVATSCWEFWSGTQGTLWHMCDDCGDTMLALVTDHFNPNTHDWYTEVMEGELLP